MSHMISLSYRNAEMLIDDAYSMMQRCLSIMHAFPYITDIFAFTTSAGFALDFALRFDLVDSLKI